MQSEDKWKKENKERKTYWRKEYDSEGYKYDDTLEEESSPLQKLLIAGAIGFGGYKAYKSGLLKKGISEGIKYAGNYKATTPTVTKTFRKWINKSRYNPDDINSLVRPMSLKTMKETSFKMIKDKAYRKNAWGQTVNDFKNLKSSVSKNIEIEKQSQMNIIKKSYASSELMYNIATVKKVSKRLRKASAQNQAQAIMNKDLVKEFIQNQDQALNKIKRTGYRNVVLGDLINEITDTAGKKKLVNTDVYNRFDNDSLDIINRFIHQTKAYDDKGNAILDQFGNHQSLYSSGMYKNLKLDSHILINEANEIADLRNINNSSNRFVRALATDYKIPFVGLNPLRFFNLDRAGYKVDKYTTLSNETFQPVITGKTGKVKIGVDLEEALGGEEMLYSDGKAFLFNEKTNTFDLFRDDLELLRVSKNKYGIGKELNDLKKIANIKTKEYKDYTEADGFIKNTLGKIGRTLDIGRQDSVGREFYEGAYSDLLSSLDPATYMEKISKKLQDMKIFNKGAGKVTDIGDAFGTASRREFADDPLYVAIKKKKSFKEALDPNDEDGIGEYFKQFFYGRDDLTKVNKGSLTVYNLFERMNQALNPFGLALSPDDTGTVFDTIKNMVAKRFLPAYMAYQGLEYVNYLSTGGDEDELTIEQKMAKGVANLDVGLHKAKDLLGVTNLVKNFQELAPGSDQILEFPGIDNLNLEKSAEEMVEYYDSGMDPIRKGRFWILGNTPFTGGKVQYYKPNWFREVMADPDFSEVKYGSREEYFDNAWFPTPTAPMSPIRHFVTDKYHYEKKHYDDRPYLLTSPELEGVPIVGPILSGTVGKIIKPQMRMHEEYWNNENTNSYSKGVTQMYVPYGEGFNEGEISGYTNNSIPVMENEDTVIGGTSTIYPKYSEKEMTSLGVLSNLNNDGKEVYTTSSGQQQMVDVNRNNLLEIREDLKKGSIKKVLGVKNRATVIEDEVNKRWEMPLGEALNPNGIESTFTTQYKDTTNVLGIYGYITNAFLVGELGEGEKVIDTSGYAYSFRDKFWQENMGGLGGDISEIFRRFVQKKRTDVEYINPIKNTMPEYLPGEEYFESFKSGDPFQKIDNGEMRLPGTPYETLWGIGDPMKMRVGSSSLGKTSDDIVQHLLRNDIITDEESLDIVNEGTKIHEIVEQEWIENGFAIDAEGKIEDKENNIVGYYDARIHDATSKTGEAIVDIKSINDKGFQKVLETGKAKEAHQKQVNYYLWATGNDKGYVHYVNRETEERYSVGFEFDQAMLDESLNNLNTARNILKEKIDNKELSRGDLYKPLDRYRILADVAPYSEEFRNMKATISKSGLREEEKKEFDEINDRVLEQKRPHRTYEYKFKTANVQEVKAKISKVEGKSIYVNIDNEQRKINFAGVQNIKTESSAEKAKYEEGKDKIKRNLVEGADIRLRVDFDELQLNKTKGLKAVVFDDNGTNINKEMVNRGYMEEDKEDWSPASVHVRFSKTERLFGRIWERLAHTDTYLNTKFLNVRSAQEDYERTEVYNKSFKTWDKPIEDYLMPSIYSAMNRPEGVFVGAFVGSLFGATKVGKVVGAVVGAGTVLVGKTYKAGYEATTGERWIPEVRRKERDLNEYVDALKYVKNMRLYNEYKDKALFEDEFDVEGYLKGKEKQAENRKFETNELNQRKEKVKKLYSEAREERDTFKEDEENRPKREYGDTTKEDKILQKEYQDHRKGYNKKKEKLTNKAKDIRADLKEINADIKEKEEFRELEILPLNALKALEYRQNAEKTMYGYDKGDPLTNVLTALPKKDRDRMKYFLKAPEEEREEILELAPNYLKRPLQSAWGMKVDEKPKLDEYFSKHQLPGEEWDGWKEGTNLDSVKVKLVNTEGLNNSEFNIWDNDVEEARKIGPIALPNINFRSSASDIRKRLLDVVGNYNIINPDISFEYSGNDLDIDLDIEHDKERRVEEKIKEYRFE